MTRLLLRIAVYIIISLAAAFWGKDIIIHNEQALSIVITLFSILAGFLVGIITLVGDPSRLPVGSWRATEQVYRPIMAKITRYKFLFQAYLLVIFLIFMALLARQSFVWAMPYLEFAFTFFATLAFLCSWHLPRALLDIQHQRIRAEIERRKEVEKEISDEVRQSTDMAIERFKAEAEQQTRGTSKNCNDNE